MWGTTASFLEKLGINSINDLPPIVEFVPGAEVVEALEAGLRIPKADDIAPVDVAPVEGAPPADAVPDQ
jgi:segregation and condensation protein B